ncbi:MAG: hypothetical protein U9R00_00885 [Patescibacteria group bacterium]|nr:hypothetical protein [Patescibacteria group bacterium]
MTTVIGINGIDVETNKSYVLILSDSQANSTKGYPTSYNEIKLFSPENSNYAFGTAGKCINNLFHSSDSSKGKLLTKEGGILEKKQLETIISGMNDSLERDFEETNDFIVGLNDDNGVNMYFQTKDKLIHGSSYVVIGSGAEYVNKELMPILSYKKHGRIYANKNDIIDFAVNVMNKTFDEDKKTGGHIDLVMMQDNDINLIRKYGEPVSENNSSNYEDEFKNNSMSGMHPKFREDY